MLGVQAAEYMCISSSMVEHQVTLISGATPTLYGVFIYLDFTFSCFRLILS